MDDEYKSQYQRIKNDLIQNYQHQSFEHNRRRSKIITYILSLLSENPNLSNFIVYVNSNNILRFNNFIIKVWLQDELHPYAYLGEVEYKEERKFIPEQYEAATWKKDIIEIINKRTEIELLEDVPDSNIYFWFYSNDFILENIKIFEVEKNNLWKSIFNFRKEIQPYKIVTKHLTEEENLLKKLYFFLNMTSDTTILSDIGDILTFSKESTENIVKYIEICFSTPQKNSITKYSFETELLRIRLSDFIVKPTHIVEVNPEHARLWNKLVLGHDVTLVDDMHRVEYIVFGCFIQQIIDISKSTFKYNDYILNHGKKSNDFSVQMLLNFLKGNTEIQCELSIPGNIEYLMEIMWKCDFLPLVLKTENVFPILKRYGYLKKKFVIIGEVKNYNIIIDQYAMIFTNVADIRIGELKDQILKEIWVSLQGRQPARLCDIIGNDVNSMRALTCSRILHLIKKRRTYLRGNCLREVEQMITIINDNDSDEMSTIIQIDGSFEPNIMVNSKSINAELYIQQIKECNKFYNHHIYHLQNGKELLFLSGNSYKVRKYLVDQDGHQVYDFGKYQSVPVIGTILGHNIQVYIDRYLRKATINKALLTKREKQIFLLCGDIESLEIGFKKSIITNPRNFEIDAETNLQVEKNIMIDVRKLPFEEYWVKFSSEGCPLFHIQVVDSSLELLNYRNCPNMSKYITYGGETIGEGGFFNKITSKITIISGETGIGKTSMLHLLSENYDNKSYVLFYNFPDYRENVLEYAPNLFRNPLSFIFEQFEVDPFKILLKNICNFHENAGKLILFIDSVDKLLPFYEPFVLGILDCLAKTNVKLIIASRLITRDMLIDNLEILPLKINHLRKDDITNSLKNKYMININLEKIPLEFLSNPLYLDCMRFIYQKQYQNLVTYDKFKLYETVIQKIIERYYCRTIDDTFSRDSFIKYHRLLSLVSLFGKKIIVDKEIIKDYNKFIEEFKNNSEIQLGIIKEIRDSYPIFLHPIFSEFLAMGWLSENITTEKCAKILYKNMMFKCVNIRYLFDRMICNDLMLHDAILKKNVDLVEYACKEDETCLQQVDKCGRTPLLLVCSYCFDSRNYRSLEVIIQYMVKKKLDFNAHDILMNWDWIQYLNFSNHRFLTQAYSHGLTTTIQVFLKHNKKKVATEDISSALNNNHLDTLLVLYRNNPSLLNEHFHKTAKIAIDHGRLDILFSLLKIQYSNSIGFRIIDKACRDKIVFTTIAKYIKITTKDGFTALHLACIYGNADLVTKLLCMETDLYAPDNFGKIPLHYTVIQGSVEVVSVLIKKMLTVNYVDDFGNGPLFFACKFSHVNVVKLLLKHGLYIGVSNIHGSSALHIAAEKGNTEIVQILLEHGATITQKDRRGNTALHLACMQDKKSVTECLIKQKDDIIAIRNNSGLTAFDIACLERKYEIVVYLLKNSPKALESDVLGSALCTIVKQGELSTLRMLVDKKLLHKKELECTIGEFGRTLLHFAVIQDRSNIVRFLLEEEVNVNAQDTGGYSPLHLACNINTAKLLLENNKCSANVNARSHKSETPLHTATLNGYVDVIKFLLSQNGQISSKDMFGWTPLHRAVVLNAVEIVTILIKHGANVNETNNDLKTPVHLVFQRDLQFRRNLPVQSSALELLSVLLVNGGNPKLKDRNGNTALHLCLKKWDNIFSLPLVNILLEYGADPYTINNDKKSSIDIGNEIGLNDILRNTKIRMG